MGNNLTTKLRPHKTGTLFFLALLFAAVVHGRHTESLGWTFGSLVAIPIYAVMYTYYSSLFRPLSFSSLDGSLLSVFDVFFSGERFGNGFKQCGPRPCG